MQFDVIVMAEATGARVFDSSVGSVKTLAHSLFSGSRSLAPGTAGTAPLATSGMMVRSFAPVSGSRNLVLALTSDAALLAQAPSAAQALAATLAVDATPQARSAFVVHSEAGSVWLIARRQDALKSAVYYLAETLGARWLAPNTAWQIPANFSASLPEESRIVKPVVAYFNYEGNGGLSGVPGLPGQIAANDLWVEWKAQARCPRGSFVGGGSDGGSGLMTDIQYEVDNDRRALAWVAAQSKRGYSGTGNWPARPYPKLTQAKLCYCHHGAPGGVYPAAPAGPTPWVGVTVPASNSALATDPGPDSATPQNNDYTSFNGVVRLKGLNRWQRNCELIQTQGVDGPLVISSAPADGAYDCDCQKCIDLLRNGPYAPWLTLTQQAQDSTYSDRLWHGINEESKFLEHMFQNAPPTTRMPVTISAYSLRIDPPSIPIYVGNGLFIRVIISSGGFDNNWPDFDQLQRWGDKLALNISQGFGKFDWSVHPEWNITVGTWDGARRSWRECRLLVAESLARDVTAFSSQTTTSFMTMGPIWYAMSRWFWGEDPDAALEEWFTKAFGTGTVRAIVRGMYERWWRPGLTGTGVGVDIRGGFEWQRQEVARAYADALAAQTALDAAPDAAIQVRLDHVKMYVHYLRLFTEKLASERAYAAAGNPTSGPVLDDYKAKLAAILEWIYSLASTNILHVGRLQEKYWGDIPATETAMRAAWNYNPGGASTMATTLPSSGAVQALCVSGAATYAPISGIGEAIYSDNLVPLTSSGDATMIPTRNHNTGTISQYRIQKPAGDVTIQVRTGTAASGLPTRVSILSLDGTVVQGPVAFSGNNVTHNMTLTGYGAGQYVIRVNERGTSGNSNLLIPRSMPCVYMGPFDWRGFDQASRPVYFFVPAGVTKIGLSMDQIPSQTPVFYDNTGAVAAHTVHDPNYYEIPVPVGQDNKIWSCINVLNRDQNIRLRFDNCPNVVAFHPDQMMIPAELL